MSTDHIFEKAASSPPRIQCSGMFRLLTVRGSRDFLASSRDLGERSLGAAPRPQRCCLAFFDNVLPWFTLAVAEGTPSVFLLSFLLLPFLMRTSVPFFFFPSLRGSPDLLLLGAVAAPGIEAGGPGCTGLRRLRRLLHGGSGCLDLWLVKLRNAATRCDCKCHCMPLYTRMPMMRMLH